jgi:hypothetical protein
MTLIQAQERLIAHVNRGNDGHRRRRKKGAARKLLAYLASIGIRDVKAQSDIVRDAIQMADLEHACQE